MQNSSITLMQRALVEWLDNEFKQAVRTVQSFDGLWTDSDVRTHIQAAPAIYVTWIGNRANALNEKKNTWSILLFMQVTNSQQTDSERELATSIIEWIEHKLHAKKLSNENGNIGGPLRHVQSDNLWHSVPKGYGFTLYRITFEQDMYPVFDDENSLDDFLTYFEKVVGGDLTLIETEAKPNEPMK